MASSNENLEEGLPEGYEIPVHRSLTEPEQMGGVPSNVVIINATLTVAMAYLLMSPLPLPFGVLLHIAAAAACSSDPEILEVFVISVRDRARRLSV